MDRDDLMFLDKYVYYLNLTTKLPDWYFVLADILNKDDITLIPITSDQIEDVISNERIHVITSVHDFAGKAKFNNHAREFLSFASKNRLIHLYFLSSFSGLSSHFDFVSKDLFHFYTLPMRIEHFALLFRNNYYKVETNISKWPGGRRAKLPV